MFLLELYGVKLYDNYYSKDQKLTWKMLMNTWTPLMWCFPQGSSQNILMRV